MAEKAKPTKRNPWVDPDDALEMTGEFLDRFVASAEISEGDKIIRPGRPPLNIPPLKPRQA